MLSTSLLKWQPVKRQLDVVERGPDQELGIPPLSHSIEAVNHSISVFFLGKLVGWSLPWHCLLRWQPSPTQHHGCPQTPSETQDCQKEDQEVHLAPIRPRCQN